MRKPLTDQQTEFLVAYRTEGRVRPAAARAGCSRELHYNALRTSETYRKAFAMVQRDFVDELEEEAPQRAIYGVKIPKFYRGEVIGYEIRYSDTLLMALLEANDPEKFGRIREELREEDGDAGFCVRWDREEVGRPTLPRMTGPMPPAPPRPPRPPVPPIAECGEPVMYAEWAAARGITGRGAYGPVNEETLDRWAASENLGSVEWVREEAAADLVSDDTDPFWETSPAADSSEQEDGDVDFCVGWGEDEHDPRERGSTPLPRQRAFRRASTHPTGRPAEESSDGDAGFCVRWGEDEHDPRERGSTPLPKPRPFRGASKDRTELLFQAYGEERGGSDVGFCVRWPQPATRAAPWAFADCRLRLHRAGSRAPPDHALRRACHTALSPSRTPTIGVAACLAQPIVFAAPVQRDAGDAPVEGDAGQSKRPYRTMHQRA